MYLISTDTLSEKCIYKQVLHSTLYTCTGKATCICILISLKLFLIFFQYIFTDIIHNYIFTTLDYGRTFSSHSVPFTPTDLKLHASNPNLVLGMNKNDTEKKVQLSVKCSQYRITCTFIKVILVFFICQTVIVFHAFHFN